MGIGKVREKKTADMLNIITKYDRVNVWEGASVRPASTLQREQKKKHEIWITHLHI